MKDWQLRCITCASTYAGLSARLRCDCGGLLEVQHLAPMGRLTRSTIRERRMSTAAEDRSGVWRFREWVLPLPSKHLAATPEGNTNLYASERLSAFTGIEGLRCKHEGENPSGSFKDRGMTAGISVARALGLRRVACASTGNTSASMAAYAARFGMEAFVLIPDGKVAFGKLSQAIAYGARTLQIAGDFDEALRLVQRLCDDHGVYLLNSVNPFRIEGQKAIAFELLEDLDWHLPDWIVVPGGNLGNSTAISKGLVELHEAGMIPRLPRMAVIQASGANPLARYWREGPPFRPVEGAETRATAIRIGAPVSWEKCLRGLERMDGVVDEVDDQAILDAKAQVDAAGIGAEPASCASVAGARKLCAAGVIPANASVVCILTGHVLKDPDAVINYHRGGMDEIRSTHANPLKRVDAAELDALFAR